MLGIGNSLMTSGLMPFSQPDDISNLIGWFDFGDVSTLFQDDDGDTSNPVTSTGDHINTILNKSKLSTKICEWLESEGTDNTPWNDSGYLDSSGGNNCVLRAKSTATIFGATGGGVATNDLSTAIVNFEAFAVFIVAHPNSATADSSETYFMLRGQSVDGMTNHSGYFQVRHSDSGKIFYAQNESSAGTEAHYAPSGETIAASKQVISVVTKPGTNASNIYINGSSELSFTALGDINLEFDENPFSAADSRRDSISISGTLGTDGTLGTGTCVDGKIYEVLLYNKELTSSEIETIHNHLIDKHNIT